MGLETVETQDSDAFWVVVRVPICEFTKRTWDESTYEVLAGAPVFGRLVRSYEPQVQGFLAAIEVFIQNHHPLPNLNSKAIERHVAQGLREHPIR